MGLTSVALLGAAVAVGVCQTNEMSDKCTDAYIRSTTYFNALAEPYESWQVALIAIFSYILVSKFWRLLFEDDMPWFQRLKIFVFRSARKIPFVRRKIQNEVDSAITDIAKSTFKHQQKWKGNHELPRKGISTGSLLLKLEDLEKMADPSKRHSEGKVSGTIYVGGPNFDEYTKLLTKVYGLFAWTNPLHTGVFPGVRQMEAEIVSMCSNLFGGNDMTCGCHTSGGTESIIMALRAYKQYYFEKKGITKPNVVAPRTAHPAFDKGCEYFGISLRHVPEDPVTRKADVRAMRRYIDSNTVALVGSCPQYPHGAADPIQDLAKVALEYDIGLHVDCCLGSFVVPFMREAGHPDFPLFDFRVKGVTSISADTHKFGCAPKGSSVLMYANPEIRRAQYSVFPDWPGGVYGTPAFSGSRPGALIAATWTALMANGYEGYLNNAKIILKTTRDIADGIKKIDGLKLMCEPEGPIVAWTSEVFDINRMVDGLIHEKGWDLNVLQFPSSIHLCVTMAHSKPGLADNFLSDLAEVTAELMKDPKAKASGAAAMYGVAQSIPDRSIIDDLVRGFLDLNYEVSPRLAPSK
eukprot:m.253951 g.253951  ORF g.253951 m.253951 type:complete len:579 (+) comp17551_c0_seq1:122-1858(+)